MQEVKLDLVPRKLCKEMGKDLQYSVDKELCAGHKVYTSRHEYYGDRKTLTTVPTSTDDQRRKDEREEFSFEIKVNASLGIYLIYFIIGRRAL